MNTQKMTTSTLQHLKSMAAAAAIARALPTTLKLPIATPRLH